MIKLELTRIFSGDSYTIGHLTINGEALCDTLEPSMASGMRIPEGEYVVKVTYSPKFKRNLPLIVVPGRKGIRFHRGNTVKDTTGCVVVGYNTIKGALTNSTECEKSLCYKLKNENEIKITVR